MPRALRIGTRGSRLALVQAAAVRAALETAHGALEMAVTPITTTGDRVTDRPLADVGGKALFTKEIDRALLKAEVDLAVHSMKDMESKLPEGLVIAAVLARADPRDCLIGASSFADLPRGARLGTSAARRSAQALHLRPDLRTLCLRGNVETRLEKQKRGECDAILLAKAGLDRLGRADAITRVLDTAEFLPAAGQGIVAILAREADASVLALLTPVDHADTHRVAQAERAFTAALGAGCRAPIGAFARIERGRLDLDGALFSPDGREVVRGRIDGEPGEAGALGARLALRLKGEASPAILATLEG